MPRTNWSIAGRTILITGAARGIGAHSARALHGRGAKLALLGLEPERLEELAVELGPAAAAFPCDVRDRLGLQEAVDAAAAHFGGIDVAIANAGIATLAPLDTISYDDFAHTVDVNVMGVYNTLRAALPHVRARQGYLLPIASLAAQLAAPLMGAYPATKAAVEQLAHTWRLEVRLDGVDIGVGYFGFIETDMVRKAFSHRASEGMRKQAPRFAFQPVPVDRAVQAIVHGIEHRARRVYAPRWIYPALLLGPVLQRVLELRADESVLRQALADARAEPLGPTTDLPEPATKA